MASSFFFLSFKVLAFVQDDTQKPINSSFVGDISNSMVNESWGKEDVPKKTDNAFAGTDDIKDDDSLFAGSNFDKEVREQSDAAFSGNETFIGKDYGK